MNLDLTAPRALIIEDHPTVLETVADMLETIGHAWDGAETVKEAIGKAERGSFDYILCDLELPLSYGRLPNLDHGLRLIETLCRMPSCKATPIIVMTGHSNTAELAAETKRRGARDFVPKPFSGDSLQEAIRLALAQMPA